MTELTEAEATKWDDALCPFRENQEDARPDAKALARMLRSDTPLNEAVRDQIAELLESRWGDRSPLARASNWELRPAWAGWRDKWLHERQREGLVLKAVDATPTIAAAMTLASESGVGGKRTAYSILAGSGASGHGGSECCRASGGSGSDPRCKFLTSVFAVTSLKTWLNCRAVILHQRNGDGSCIFPTGSGWSVSSRQFRYRQQEGARRSRRQRRRTGISQGRPRASLYA